jgi:RecB family exonuclease
VEEPDASAALAEALFDKESTEMCEALALPQHQAERGMLRRTIVESARELVRLAAHHGARTMMTEVPRTMGAAGHAIAGRLDLVWDDPAVVIDLKWGKKTPADELETGTAVQLAAYAAMNELDGRRPETAYFVLLTQQLLAEPGGRLAAEATMTGAYSSSQVWSAALSSIQRRREELATGRLEAPGALGTLAVEIEPGFSPTALQLATPCGYCDFARLCGRKGAL